MFCVRMALTCGSTKSLSFETTECIQMPVFNVRISLPSIEYYEFLKECVIPLLSLYFHFCNIYLLLITYLIEEYPLWEVTELYSICVWGDHIIYMVITTGDPQVDKYI